MKLSHLDSQGRIRMVDVGGKAETERVAVAKGEIRMRPETLQLITEGHTNSAIAQMLQVSVKTVEKHRASLMAKLNVHDVASLVRAAIKHNLVLLEE